DCADVCQAMARLAVRRTGQNIEVLRLMLDSCATICDLCATECEQHEHAHCKLCAEMCRECANDCRSALPTVQ
ncbi:MAG: four-helix bundle copper-binding protein, partial [Burkholderiales bacterium]